jgi:hypothetical protein
MDSEGNLLADKLKDAFTKHQSPVVDKVADVEKFVDSCVAKNGEIKGLCFPYPSIISH